MKVTNTQAGPRGINTKTGPVLLDPGQTRDDLEISDAEYNIANETGWFKFDGKPNHGPGGNNKPNLTDAEAAKAAAELLTKKDSLHFQTFRKEASEILGPDNAPDKKEELVAALEAAAKKAA